MANALAVVSKLVSMGDAAITGFTAVNWESDTITAYLVDSADDTLNPLATTDQDLADLLAGARVDSANLASVTVTQASGTVTVDAADTTLAAASGDQAEHVYLFQNTGTEATSLFLVYFDTFASGMPVTPNGGDITLAWHASGIFTW